MLDAYTALADDPDLVHASRWAEHAVRRAKLPPPIVSAGVDPETGDAYIVLTWVKSPHVVSVVVAPGCATLRVPTPAGGTYVRSVNTRNPHEREEGADALRTFAEALLGCNT